MPHALSKLTRREFVQVSGAVLAATALAGLPGCAPGTPTPSPVPTPDAQRRFRSRPDLAPPAVTMNVTSQLAPGSIFVGANGPLIIDNTGEPVWFLPSTGSVGATNFRMQQYRGRPVLTWWEGTIIPQGYGQGRYVIYDDSYRRIGGVDAASGLQGDLHEFLITPEDTALFTAYTTKAADLRSVGGSAHDTLLDSVIQERDIASGALLFEWRSSDHVPLGETHGTYSKGTPFDYFHVNSIDIDADRNLLVSARNTWCAYKLHRTTGAVMWRMGGRQSSFSMQGQSQFYWQHDARRQPDGTITLFDDGASPQEEAHSRGLVLAVDETDMQVSVLRAYIHPRGLLSGSQGSVQLLPNGDVFVGYGQLPNFAEYSENGSILLDANFVSAIQSYRALRFPWVGRPAAPPDIAVVPEDGGTAVYASWNGATEVSQWRVLAGASRTSLAPVATAQRTGFETRILVRTTEPWIAVEALNASMTAMARSGAHRLAG